MRKASESLGPEVANNLAGPKNSTPTVPNKPSIAVLPFINLSSDPEQEYFGEGIVEDIITALSRFKSLFVIARNSTFTYKGKTVDVGQVGRDLCVRYVLEGSVRKAGNRVRITVKLIEATAERSLWAEKFDSALEDMFDLQDQITAGVVGLIAPKSNRLRLSARNKNLPTDWTVTTFICAVPHYSTRGYSRRLANSSRKPMSVTGIMPPPTLWRLLHLGPSRGSMVWY